ncbi:MAG: response regulator transcription factor [Nitriliruptoraceae bacterium]
MTSTAGRSATRTVLVVDDHELFAESLTVALEANGFTAHRPLGVTPTAIGDTVRRVRPDIVLLDYDLANDGPTGAELTPELVELGCVVVVVTGIDHAPRMAECLEAGALSVVNKSQPLEALVHAVEQAANNRSVISQARRQELLAALRHERSELTHWSEVFDRLTQAEAEVLGRLMQGVSAEAIAEERVVSVRTVRTQIESILAKLEVHSQLGAVALANRAHWTPPS